jgi:hypothetical protein
MVHFVTIAEKQAPRPHKNDEGAGFTLTGIALQDAYRPGAKIFDGDIFEFLKSGFIANEKWQQDRGECISGHSDGGSGRAAGDAFLRRLWPTPCACIASIMHHKNALKGSKRVYTSYS